MAYTSIMIIDAKSNLFTVRVALEQRYDVAVSHIKDATLGLELVQKSPPDYILANPNGIRAQVTEFLTQLAQIGKNIPVIVVGNQEMVNEFRSVYGRVVGHVPRAYNESDLLSFLQQQRPTQTGKLRGKALAERAALVQANQLLERRVQEAMTLNQIGKSVASLTDLDTILTRIVEAAVFMLRSEEASIMLVDLETNELYLRSQKGLGEKQARGLYLKVQDTLIGSVVRTGRPIMLAQDGNKDARLKVVTGYLVHALLYVPLLLRDRVIGVLGVTNQNNQKAFNKHDQRLMEALADYAALAIEVARQHEMIQKLRQELAVARTTTCTVQELRQQMVTDEPEIMDALHRVEDVARILTSRVATEAPTDV